MSAKSFIVVLILMIISGFSGAFICYLFLNLDRFYENNPVNVTQEKLSIYDNNLLLNLEENTTQEIPKANLEENLSSSNLEQNLSILEQNLNETNSSTEQNIFAPEPISKEQERIQNANLDSSILENPKIPQEYIISDMPPAIVIPKEEIKKSDKSDKKDKKETKETKETKISKKTKQEKTKKQTESLIKELSTQNIQTFIKNGEELSQYRLNLLKNMLEPVFANDTQAKFKILVSMFDNNNMSIQIQNLSLIKQDKNPQDYINLTQKKINFHYNKNEIENFSNKDSLLKFINDYKNNSFIKLIHIKAYSDGKGSDFANYMLGLKRGVYLAHFFLDFSEEIQIQSFGKENYPENASNTEEQRYQHRKVELSF